MTAKDVLASTLDFNHGVLKTYVSDLSDADLLVRPVDGANHIAWQLGHLIASECRMLQAIPGATPPDLPAGFAEKHDRNKTGEDQGFATKAEYMELFEKVRQSTKAALENLSESDLDKPNPTELSRLAPTLGSVFLLAANHELMHAGQFAVIRRKLGKPIVI
ncbi:MAG: hypothetical protein KatS3mg105_1675 [Gemmatales bacterium]|nr:MAG: hypothetical protein KatS3mg105_1675 [Gemmatales bacterium]